MLTHIDLFAGIGGFSLAFDSEGFRTVAYSEINPDKCLVYESHFPGVPNLGDIKSIRGDDVRTAHGPIDVLTGGVPCQPASTLGQMRGSADERWLWPEAIRLVREIRPRFAVFENPPSLLVLEGGRAWNGIVSGLAALGYDLWWDVFPAAAFGAGHLRERVLLVIADPDSQRRQRERLLLRAAREAGRGTHQDSETAGGGESQLPADALRRRPTPPPDLQQPSADSERMGLQERLHQCDRRPGDCVGQEGLHDNEATTSSYPRKIEDLSGRVNRADWWHEAHTGIPVLADGLPARLVEAAARCAGDSVVPQVVQPIAKAIKEMLSVVWNEN